jgi:5-methyltetrahydrofolate--homocysteine methyltransferase
MMIIAERINSTRKSVAKAISEKDEGFSRDLAERQAGAGADFLDVNAGAFPTDEAEHLKWLVTVCQEAVDTPLSLDSPNPEALKQALPLVKKPPFINSITGEASRMDQVVPLVLESGANVICLCMDEGGMPETSVARMEVAKRTFEKLDKAGLPAGNVFFDPLVQPVSTNAAYGPLVLDTIGGIREALPGCHIICGLSNVSFGLPQRKLINRNFLSMCVARGLDSAILDPLDELLMANVHAARMLAGRDEYCMDYLSAHKEGKLGG